MHIISLTYLKPLDDVEKYIKDHIKFLDKYYEEKKFICSGRKIPRTGGIILTYDCNIDEIQAIIKEDPFYQNKLASYEVIEFSPSKFDPSFEKYITK